jgi:hypothetical protein
MIGGFLSLLIWATPLLLAAGALWGWQPCSGCGVSCTFLGTTCTIPRTLYLTISRGSCTCLAGPLTLVATLTYVSGTTWSGSVSMPASGAGGFCVGCIYNFNWDCGSGALTGTLAIDGGNPRFASLGNASNPTCPPDSGGTVCPAVSLTWGVHNVNTTIVLCSLDPLPGSFGPCGDPWGSGFGFNASLSP